MKKRFPGYALLWMLVASHSWASGTEGDGDARGFQEEPIGFGMGALAGAALAGPPGLLVGAGIGLLLGRQSGQGKALDEAGASLARAQANSGAEEIGASSNGETDRSGHSSNADSGNPLIDSMRAMEKGVAVTVAFRTGVHSLEPHFQMQLTKLAHALRAFPALRVKLEGHTDPRGSRRFNKKLSDQRVAAVRRTLVEAGLNGERILTTAYGESHAMYQQGDKEGYPFDRRVLVTFTMGGHE